MFLLALLGAGLVAAPRAMDVETLRRGFAEPPAEARPWAYWFWWNSTVSNDEIARELQEFADAGYGGIELRVATFHGWSGPKLEWMDDESLRRIGHKRLEYLSEEWLDALQFTCETARKLGLQISINLGQGWPTGGKWITDQHRTKHLAGKAREVDGPVEFALGTAAAERLVYAWKLNGRDVLKDTFVDLSTRTSWKVPEGRWLIGTFTVTPGGLCDKGEGPEVDPASHQAMLFHLNYVFSRLDPKLRRYYGSTLVEVASDSWEYEPKRGARFWSSAVMDAFPQVAGYDFRSRMHALLNYGPGASGTLHDLEEVERQLVRDNFFGLMSRFLHERGLRLRPQVYGRGLKRDLLETYSLVDTPETEQGDYAVPEAPWAARTTGKPVISVEAFTHLNRKMGPIRRPHGEWESNPAALRGAANFLFGEGINRIQMHCLSYSPPGLPLPGWRMYAELHLNRNVPWWPYLKTLNTWLARQSWVLQAGWPAADALVYPVKSNPDDGPFREMGERQPVSAANAVDGANEYTLPLVREACVAGKYSFQDLILLRGPKSAAEARMLADLLQCGRRAVFTQSSPEEWLEFRGRAARAANWKSAVAEAQSVRWSPAQEGMVFQHRRLKDADVYVLVNSGDDFAGEVSFPHAGKHAEFCDADTGQMPAVARLTESAGRMQIPLRLAHAESACLAFSSEARPVFVTESDGGSFLYDAGVLAGRFGESGKYLVRTSDGEARRLAVHVPATLPVTGPWTLSVDASQAVSPQAPVTLTLERLTSWRNLPELTYYAGRASYRTEVTVPRDLAGEGLVLDLGSVFELARVRVNEVDAGVAYAPPFRVDVTGLLHAGRNTIEIEVPNQLKNHLERTGAYERPSGLLGPVLLVPSKRVRLR